MPSSNGVYSLPQGYLAVTGTTIQASQHNPPLEDIAAALTLRLSRDGTAPMTGGLQAVTGTAAVPSYAFATDASTGLFKTTNGVGVTVGGTQVAEFTAAGMASGVRMLGELTTWIGITPPSLWVFPHGQTLSRTTYAALWAFAQTQIAGGSTFFNNGDGSTTFGIGDLRGCVIAAADNMGGNPGAGRLTTISAVIGSRGGEQTHVLAASEIPTITGLNSNSFGISVTTQDFGIFSNSGVVNSATGGGNTYAYSVNTASSVREPSFGSVSPNTIAFTSNNTGGAAHNNVQPTMVLNFIMFAGA